VAGNYHKLRDETNENCSSLGDKRNRASQDNDALRNKKGPVYKGPQNDIYVTRLIRYKAGILKTQLKSL